MHKKLLLLGGLLLLQSSSIVFACELGINVILSGQIAPGIYGEVELGNAPRPRVVYAQPVVILADKRYVRVEPIYLHVPPGHAKKWSKHCHDYNACGRKVYFVKSEEYEPEYINRNRHSEDENERRHVEKHHEKNNGKHGGKHGH